MDYLDSSSDQSQNRIPTTDFFNLSSKDQPGVVSQGSSTGGNPNPSLNSNLCKGERGSSNSKLEWCEHCKKAGHTRDLCWRLHPELRPVKGRRGLRGGSGAVEKRRESGVLRKGEKEIRAVKASEKNDSTSSSGFGFDSTQKRLDRIATKISQIASLMGLKVAMGHEVSQIHEKLGSSRQEGGQSEP